MDLISPNWPFFALLATEHRAMRLLQLVVLVAAALNASAFTTKKREPTRPAFKASLANANNAATAPVEQESAREEYPVLAFAGYKSLITMTKLLLGIQRAFWPASFLLPLAFPWATEQSNSQHKRPKQKAQSRLLNLRTANAR
jgi:hypothetical protein